MNKPITPLASMEARLKATGVYRLAATDLVYLELCAYQSALSVLFEGVLELEREGFLSTAQDWGLAEAEWRYGLAADGLTAAERRRRVQAYAYSRTAGGLEAFTALLAAMGCTGNAVLDGERWCVYLETAPPSGQAEALLWQKLMGAAPANAEVELMVRPAAWDALDALAESWAAWEAKKLDWDAFDSGAGLQPEQNRKGGIYFADKP
ncbi:Uncharacterised protein [uncultured Ruminococcus sp.]|nr:Uncharacterised protein [uncultured Ruminococcus sp.]